MDIKEKYNSRRLKRGKDPSFTIAYLAYGYDDEADAEAAVLAAVDPTATIAGVDYPITDVETIAIADNIWEVTLTYGQGITVEISISGDTTGGRGKITQSKATTSYAPSGMTAPNFNGAIGVTKTSIEGVEVPVPALQFTIKCQIPAAGFTWEMVKTWSDLTGTVNNATFQTFNAGEVRFDGAVFDQKQVGQPVDVHFKFTREKNVTALAIGAITGITKAGHQYLWVRYQEYEDTTAHCLVTRRLRGDRDGRRRLRRHRNRIMSTGNPFGRLQPGDALTSFPSRAWNDLLEMLVEWKQLKRKLSAGTGGMGLESARTLIPVKNTTESNLNRCAVLRLDDFLISPADSLPEFKERPAFRGALPEASNGEAFGILYEPIAAGAIGLAILAGVAPVQIDVTNASHHFADTIQGDATKLRSCLWGPVEILTRQSGTGTKWAYVSLGHFHRAARFRGVTTEAINEDAVGGVDVYRRSSSTGYTATGETVEALNDVDVDIGAAGAVVEVEFDGLDDDGDPLWRIVNPDFVCPEDEEPPPEE
jgi:hypothetical protein